MQNKKVLVSVIVLTYNQESTISRTIESILAQKTKYSYEIVIGEDCSVDKTRTICEKFADDYPNVHLLPKESNKGVVRNYFDAFRKTKGKYIMGCAGDDWWHNDMKIQTQIDYMISHPDCCLVFGNIIKFNKSKHCYISKANGIGELTLEELMLTNPIPAVTMCYLRDIIRDEEIDNILNKQFLMEDYPLILFAAMRGKVHGIPDTLATYTVAENSISNSANLEKKEKFEENVLNLRLYFKNKYDIKNISADRIYDSFYLSLAINGIRYGDKGYCIKNLYKIKEKRLSDYLKLLLCYMPYGFAYMRYYMKDLIIR